MKSFSKKQNKNGFSIIEVIVAVGIITIGIIPIITLFNQNLKSEIKNKNTLIAAYLANESIEIVRQQRDNNWFKTPPDPWMTNFDVHPVRGAIVGLNDNTSINKGWEIVRNNPSEEREKVYLFNDSYVQHEDSKTNWAGWGWTETPFERHLTIDTGVGTSGCLVGHEVNCMRITSYVSSNGTTVAEVTAYLYDGWK